MKAEVTDCTVVEIKFNPGLRQYQITIEIAEGAHICMLCPYEHKWKVGDKVKLYVDVPLMLERFDPSMIGGA